MLQSCLAQFLLVFACPSYCSLQATQHNPYSWSKVLHFSPLPIDIWTRVTLYCSVKIYIGIKVQRNKLVLEHEEKEA
jgi:hypothetical protein